jgi:tRNA(adenine34) deaminase
MREALAEAESARAGGEVPVGAVVVLESRILGRGRNQIESLQDPTAHAEILAIGAAANATGSWRLDGATLYVTLEPCPMCAGALLNARLARLVFGAKDPLRGACGSVVDLLAEERLNPRLEMESGVLGEECARILKVFFENLRRDARAG